MTTLLASVNDRRVTRLSVRVPWCGAWTADADFDEAVPAEELAGQARVKIGPLALSGSMDPSLTGTYLAQSKCYIVGGAAGWDRKVTRKAYHDDGLGIRARTVIEDLAREVGERLGAVAPSRERLGADWIRRQGEASAALALAAGSAPWWVDYDGITRVGPRPAVEVSGQYEILDVDPRYRTVEIATDDPSGIGIGSILRGRMAKPMTVRELAIEVADGRVRVLCWGTDGGLEAYVAHSRLLRDLQAVARAAFPELPYSRIYRYRVVNANPGDHRWELQAVSNAQSLPDISPASVHPGVAGAVAKLAQGAVVLVQFVESDPSMPVITHFPARDGAGWLPLELEIDASSKVTIGESADDVLLGPSPRLGVARMGDAVQAGPFGGVIVGASSRVKAGT
jgi:hypothetical protein